MVAIFLGWGLRIQFLRPLHISANRLKVPTLERHQHGPQLYSYVPGQISLIGRRAWVPNLSDTFMLVSCTCLVDFVLHNYNLVPKSDRNIFPVVNGTGRCSMQYLFCFLKVRIRNDFFDRAFHRQLTQNSLGRKQAVIKQVGNSILSGNAEMRCVLKKTCLQRSLSLSYK